MGKSRAVRPGLSRRRQMRTAGQAPQSRAAASRRTPNGARAFSPHPGLRTLSPTVPLPLCSLSSAERGREWERLGEGIGNLRPISSPKD